MRNWLETCGDRLEIAADLRHRSFWVVSENFVEVAVFSVFQLEELDFVNGRADFGSWVSSVSN